jgi:hypothetical protein
MWILQRCLCVLVSLSIVYLCIYCNLCISHYWKEKLLARLVMWGAHAHETGGGGGGGGSWASYYGHSGHTGHSGHSGHTGHTGAIHAQTRS